ncbi:hypothetical protein HanXRQr2_Chr16g0738961 [Helianthus annuus]|uniref:Uncharacterized protein n=1 Tax=Helianthus annuus TaxID=4232 RepID=A0A9K3DRQ7_HELAN|nr:hypothetical protein HanXRQr2_Chr16g0738961 [Helianthus annuus]KAJ0437474.1 hypothetical protein HanHA300_Chr16g0602601 [Helianthus annuus]KAJ0459792.1 hypothetical protein HanHA89_Chr16g0653121 [Helianthus annuus]
MFRSSFDVRFSVMVQFWCLGSNSVDSGQLSRRHKLWVTSVFHPPKLVNSSYLDNRKT